MQYDMIVIGSGPAGQKAALQASKAGHRVAIIEQRQVGGGCVHTGTLPSKSFRESVYRFSLGSRGAIGQELEYWNSKEISPELPDMLRLLKRRDRVVRVEAQVVQDQLQRNRIDVFHGIGRFLSPHEVNIVREAGDEVITGKTVVIAVGARPVPPEGFDVDGKRVLDSNTILNLKEMPKSMVVLGAGIIGCEYASMFACAGTKVHLVDKRHEILASVDREVVEVLEKRFKDHNMEILHSAETEKLEVIKVDGTEKVRVTLKVEHEGGFHQKEITADVALIAMGRMGNTGDLGLEKVGIPKDSRGLITVDKTFRTQVPNVFAVGDVIGFPALASTSMEQGRIAACAALSLNDEFCSRMPEPYPYGIYTIPEISTIGETEESLKEKGIEYVAGRARYREIARGQIVGDRWGLLKLLVEKNTMKILGVHIIGDSAADLIHIGQAVMTLNGDVTYFLNVVFNYPTLAEGYKTAALSAYNALRGRHVTR